MVRSARVITEGATQITTVGPAGLVPTKPLQSTLLAPGSSGKTPGGATPSTAVATTSNTAKPPVPSSRSDADLFTSVVGVDNGGFHQVVKFREFSRVPDEIEEDDENVHSFQIKDEKIDVRCHSAGTL